MTTHKEALTLALEMVQNKMYAHAEMYLKEALAQEQEPMPCNICGKQMNTGRVEDTDCGGDCCACMALMGDPDCEARLSKHKQEPVAWMCHPFGDDECEFSDHQECENCTPLYTPPPQRTWFGLTDEEINKVLGGDIHDEPNGLLEFVRAIEAKLKEKNA